MTEVSTDFRARWRSGDHVGEAKPEMRVYLRRGRWRRGYHPWGYDDMDRVSIPGESPSKPWMATWQGFEGPARIVEGNIDPSATFEDWIEVPQILECELTHGFDQNGITSATITLENIILAEQAAVSPMTGAFHMIEHGYFSPYRGYAPKGRERPGSKNAWYKLLFRNVELRVDQGYGDEMVTTFKGCVDDVDLTSRPERIVITARDFGQVLVDSRVFGWNTSKQLTDPVVFADRHKAEDRKAVGGGGHASSHRDGYGAQLVTDDDPHTAWYSSNRDHPEVTEWVEVVLPAGRYSSVRLECVANMQAYIGVFASGGSLMDGEAVGGFLGDDEVPGDTNGGWKYLRRIGATSLGVQSYSLGADLHLEDDSVLRVGFRHLPLTETGHYNAVVIGLAAWRRTRSEEAKKRRWIIVDDVADVVKVLLRWAGFKEWQIENVGAGLADNLIVNRDSFYMDVIRDCCEKTGYEFHVADPSGPESIGIPTFRQNSSLRRTNAPTFSGDPKPIRTIRDRDLLTGLNVKLTDEPLAYIIRVRGARDKEGRLLSGDPGDTGRRKMATFRPPWTIDNRMGGMLKHVIHLDPYLKTDKACTVAAMLIALAEALKSATAVAQIPGNPEFELDDQAYLLDHATGTSTRLWLASRSSTFTTGSEAKWTMTLGGSLIDTPDIVKIKQYIQIARAGGLEIPQIGGGPPISTVQADDFPPDDS